MSHSRSCCLAQLLQAMKMEVSVELMAGWYWWSKSNNGGTMDVEDAHSCFCASSSCSFWTTT